MDPKVVFVKGSLVTGWFTTLLLGLRYPVTSVLKRIPNTSKG